MQCLHFLSYYKNGLALVIRCNLPMLPKTCLENGWCFTSHPSPLSSHPTHFSAFSPQRSQRVKQQTPKPPSILAWAAAYDDGGFLSSTFTSHLAPSTAQGGHGQGPAPQRVPPPGSGHGAPGSSGGVGTTPSPLLASSLKHWQQSDSGINAARGS